MKYIEQDYQKNLEFILKGRHVTIPYVGVTDITTDEFHAEIKTWKAWKSVISQLYCYNRALPRNELRAYFFGKKPSLDTLNVIVDYINSVNLTKIYHVEINNNYVIIYDLLNISNVETYPVCNLDNVACTFLDIYKIEIKQACSSMNVGEFTVNLDDISKWLNTEKKRLIETLKSSYKLNIDYTLKKGVNPNKKSARHNNYKVCLLTLDCFKRLCMLSKAKNSDIVRQYLSSI